MYQDHEQLPQKTYDGEEDWYGDKCEVRSVQESSVERIEWLISQNESIAYNWERIGGVPVIIDSDGTKYMHAKNWKQPVWRMRDVHDMLEIAIEAIARIYFGVTAGSILQCRDIEYREFLAITCYMHVYETIPLNDPFRMPIYSCIICNEKYLQHRTMIYHFLYYNFS